MHKDSILQPTIIILLKDNNFERVKKLLSTCPHGINIKMIRNSGEATIYKVVNVGANSPDEFLNAFANQCFSTCSHTSRDVILNEEWAENSLIKRYCPNLLKIRSNLICDEKNAVLAMLNEIIYSLENYDARNSEDIKLLNSILCMSKIFRICCNDFGGQDIIDAFNM